MQVNQRKAEESAAGRSHGFLGDAVLTPLCVICGETVFRLIHSFMKTTTFTQICGREREDSFLHAFFHPAPKFDKQCVTIMSPNSASDLSGLGPTHDFIASCTDHLRSYADFQMLTHLRVGIKKSHLLVSPLISPEMSLALGSCQVHSGKLNFSKILAFFSKFKFYYGQQTLSIAFLEVTGLLCSFSRHFQIPKSKQPACHSFLHERTESRIKAS